MKAGRFLVTFSLILITNKSPRKKGMKVDTKYIRNFGYLYILHEDKRIYMEI